MTEFLGRVDIKNTSGSEPRIALQGDSKEITIFGNDGKITIFGNDGHLSMRLGKHWDDMARSYDAVSIWNADGDKTTELTLGTLQLGGGGVDGQLSLRNKEGDDSIILDGSNGDMTLYDAKGGRGFALRSREPSLGGNTTGMWIGANPGEGQKAGYLCIRNNDGNDSIEIDGRSGDIILNNADCAEDFDILNSTEIDPGTVMVIEQEGKLKECDLPYDKRVAGVISGAGNYKPGLVLDKRKKSVESRKSISLMGKVFCKVDARPAPIDVGDLLTTSYTRGHAMKAVDPVKAFGSVIGKALKPLEEGSRRMIPVLVALQ
jgi:hypothetical protein